MAHENFSYPKVYSKTKYVEKVEKNEGKPAFQNIKDLTNGSSEITKVGRSQRMFLKTKCSPYKGFRSSRPGRSVKKMFLKVSQNSQENNNCGVSF